jgi:DNA repair exonuclease SbcCD ATPase subunit
MKLEFLNQRMHNFKAFIGTHEFEWAVPGVTFIRGENQSGVELESNGASKSSIFDAFCWCLTGRTPTGLRNPDVVPWVLSVDKGTKVSVNYLNSGQPHTVQRCINPNSLTFDGEDTDQEKLEAKLGFNFALLTNTIILAQDCPLFFDRTPEKKMELFAEALELGRWDARVERAGAKQVQSEEDLIRLRARKEACAASLLEIDTLLAETKSSAENWAATARKNKREGAKRITVLEYDLQMHQQRYDAAKLKEDGAATELVSLRKEADKLVNESHVAERAYAEAELRVQAAQLRGQQSKTALAKIKTAKVCPTCGQPVKPANLTKHLRELETELSTAQAIVTKGIPVKVRTAVEFYTKRLEDVQRYAASFEAKREAVEGTLARLLPEVERLRAELKELRKAVGEEDQVNPFQAQIRGLQERRAALGGQVTSLEKDFSSASARAERYKFWRKGFRDIKLQLVDEVLGELEIVTNGMLDDVGLVGWEVRYDIERETKSGTVKRALHVEIRSPESKGFVNWAAWSGGERQRLKLVGTLALSDVLLAKAGVETNLEILDEPALYWSAAGVHDLCAFLADRARRTKRCIFFVEHSASESAHFSNVVTVVKDKKGAYISN